MAFKTGKKIKQELEAFFRFRTECLNRHPDYAKDYRKMVKYSDEMDRLAVDMTDNYEEELEEEYDQIAQDYSALLIKYNVRRHPPPKPNDPNGWRTLQESNMAVVLESNDARWIDPMIYSLSGIHHYEQFRVDIGRDKKESLRELSAWIDKVRILRKKKGDKQAREEKIQLSKADRYFKVFDLRNKKPPVSYNQIALKLLDEHYPHKSLEQAEAMAKHDFRRIFKAIYGISYKEYDSGKLIKSEFKGCHECPKRNECRDLCADAEYALSLIEVKQKHHIGKKDISEWSNV